MKTVPAMLGTPRLFREFFILHLGLWSILCEKATKRNDEECPVQLTITRNSKQSARTGELFKIQCPVKYCVHRPNVTWCKHNGTICVPLEVSPQLYTSWEENQSVPVFVLHFKPIHLSDNGSYSCSTNFNSQVINSHSVTIHVTERGREDQGSQMKVKICELCKLNLASMFGFSIDVPILESFLLSSGFRERTQNSSEHPLITVSDIPDATNASGPSTMEERPGRTWLLYTLLPLGALLLLLACVCLLCFLKRIQGKEKKPSDLAGRDTNLVDIPASSRTNHQALPSGTGIYDNDPWSSMQDESELTISLQSERNNQGIVYASLNHCVIGRNPRQENNMQEAPTEYASICVRS